MSTERPLLQVRDLKVSYGVVPAVRGVDLSVKTGEVYGVVGPNGAGKTSLLSGIGGIVRATGTVELDGTDVSRWPAHRRGAAGMSFVSERRRVFPSLSVRENLAVAGWGLPKDEVDERIDRVLATFPRLGERMDVPPFRLSGGEQRMLSLGRVLVSGARVILFDELSLGLAPRIVAMLVDTILELAETGHTIVLVEQYIGVLLQVAQDVMVMERGRAAFAGRVDDAAAWLNEHGYMGATGKSERRIPAASPGGSR